MPELRPVVVSGADVLERVPGVEAHTLPDHSVLLFEQGSGTALPLNESGAQVWKMCDGTHTIDEIVDHLAACYDANRSQIERDTREFIAVLVGHGLMDRRSHS